jgi:hypothetical protein
MRIFNPEQVTDLGHLAPVGSVPDMRCGPPCALACTVRTSFESAGSMRQ